MKQTAGTNIVQKIELASSSLQKIVATELGNKKERELIDNKEAN